MLVFTITLGLMLTSMSPKVLLENLYGTLPRAAQPLIKLCIWVPGESENAKKYLKKFLEVELEFFNYLRFISIAQFGRFYVSFKYSDFITNYNKIPKNIFKYFFAFSDSEGLPLHFCKKDLVSIFKID